MFGAVWVRAPVMTSVHKLYLAVSPRDFLCRCNSAKTLWVRAISGAVPRDRAMHWLSAHVTQNHPRLGHRLTLLVRASSPTWGTQLYYGLDMEPALSDVSDKTYTAGTLSAGAHGLAHGIPRREIQSSQQAPKRRASLGLGHEENLLWYAYVWAYEYLEDP